MDARQFYVLPLLHANGIPVDLVLAGTPFELEALERAHLRVLQGVHVPVVCAEDLLVFKLTSDRALDHEDAAFIVWRTGPDLDLDLVGEPCVRRLCEAAALSFRSARTLWGTSLPRPGMPARRDLEFSIVPSPRMRPAQGSEP